MILSQSFGALSFSTCLNYNILTRSPTSTSHTTVDHGPQLSSQSESLQNSQSRLKVHSRNDSGEMSFLCSFSVAKFSSHLVTLRDTKELIPDVCTKSFSESSTLKTHKLSHSGKKLFSLLQLWTIFCSLEWLEATQHENSQCIWPVICLSVCPYLETHFPVDWRLLVKNVSLIMAYLFGVFVLFFCFNNFLHFDIFLGFCLFPKQPTMHSGGFSRGRSVAVAVGVSDWWHVTPDTWHVIHDTWHFFFPNFLLLFCLFWYRCSYLHTSRDSVSPACRIYFNVHHWNIPQFEIKHSFYLHTV